MAIFKKNFDRSLALALLKESKKKNAQMLQIVLSEQLARSCRR